MERYADYLARYKSISNKLKKRFLKKPNVAEGSEQFASLAKTFEQQECPQYAGFCLLALARCEHTLGSVTGEAHALTEAARAFVTAERRNREVKCPSLQEHIDAAVNCYSHAIRVHVENKQTFLAATLCIELGNILKSFDKTSEAIPHYQRAAEFQILNPLECLTSLGLVASSKIIIGDHEGALLVFTEMSYMVQERGVTTNGKLLGVFSDIMSRCEVSRVLLLMLLQPTPQRIRPEHAQTLEKYAWQSTDNNSDPIEYMPEDLFLLLQSFMMACQSRDFDALACLQTEMWSYLSSEQNDIVHLVLKHLKYPPGEGF